MKDPIGYLRVSTKEQGRSGLGLATQRHDIEAFGSREGFSIKSWHQDIQTGASLTSELRSGMLRMCCASLDDAGSRPRGHGAVRMYTGTRNKKK
ncbi:MAG: recombinase family protein [Steroidobacteraceae bacterium]